jgi:hypothetical protein
MSWSDSDNMPPRDYVMPKLGPWRWVWLALAFSVPIMVPAALVKARASYTNGMIF